MENEQSPLPPKVETKVEVNENEMDFYSAIKEIMRGKKVTRRDWPDVNYCLLQDDVLTIFTKGSLHSWVISIGDIDGKDWVIIN